MLRSSVVDRGDERKIEDGVALYISRLLPRLESKTPNGPFE